MREITDITTRYAAQNEKMQAAARQQNQHTLLYLNGLAKKFPALVESLFAEDILEAENLIHKMTKLPQGSNLPTDLVPAVIMPHAPRFLMSDIPLDSEKQFYFLVLAEQLEIITMQEYLALLNFKQNIFSEKAAQAIKQALVLEVGTEGVYREGLRKLNAFAAQHNYIPLLALRQAASWVKTPEDFAKVSQYKFSLDVHPALSRVLKNIVIDSLEDLSWILGKFEKLDASQLDAIIFFSHAGENNEEDKSTTFPNSYLDPDNALKNAYTTKAQNDEVIITQCRGYFTKAYMQRLGQIKGLNIAQICYIIARGELQLDVTRQERREQLEYVKKASWIHLEPADENKNETVDLELMVKYVNAYKEIIQSINANEFRKLPVQATENKEPEATVTGLFFLQKSAQVCNMAKQFPKIEDISLIAKLKENTSIFQLLESKKLKEHVEPITLELMFQVLEKGIGAGFLQQAINQYDPSSTEPLKHLHGFLVFMLDLVREPKKSRETLMQALGDSAFLPEGRLQGGVEALEKGVKLLETIELLGKEEKREQEEKTDKLFGMAAFVTEIFNATVKKQGCGTIQGLKELTSLQDNNNNPKRFKLG